MASQNSQLVERKRRTRFAIRERSLLRCMSPKLALFHRPQRSVSLPCFESGPKRRDVFAGASLVAKAIYARSNSRQRSRFASRQS
jgi:hypothetical protein